MLPYESPVICVDTEHEINENNDGKWNAISDESSKYSDSCFACLPMQSLKMIGINSPGAHLLGKKWLPKIRHFVYEFFM